MTINTGNFPKALQGKGFKTKRYGKTNTPPKQMKMLRKSARGR